MFPWASYVLSQLPSLKMITLLLPILPEITILSVFTKNLFPYFKFLDIIHNENHLFVSDIRWKRFHLHWFCFLIPRFMRRTFPVFLGYVLHNRLASVVNEPARMNLCCNTQSHAIHNDDCPSFLWWKRSTNLFAVRKINCLSVPHKKWANSSNANYVQRQTFFV